MKDVRTYYDDFSHTYDRGRDRGYHAHIDEMESECVHRWLQGPRVLEIGCGTGLLLDRVRRFAPGVRGADISLEMLRRAGARGHSVCQSSALALPFRDGSWDVVYSFKVLPHIEDLPRALEEARRVLVPGGIALLEFYNPRSLRGLWKRLRWWKVRVGRGSHDREVYTRYHAPDEVDRMVRAAGLEPCGACGVVLLTPHPAAHRVPGLGGLLRLMERGLCRGPFVNWAGFYVVVARRGGH